MRIVVLFLLVQTATSAFSGFVDMMESSGYTFAFFDGDTDTTNWNMAKGLCLTKVSSRATLAMLKTNTTSADVIELLNRYGNPQAWLGGTDSIAEDYWKWVDTTQFSYTYTNWAPNQPNSAGGDKEEDCLAININKNHLGTWSDKECMGSRGFVCQLDMNRALASDFSELIVLDKMPRTFWGAKQECERIGARLVEITDEESKEIIWEKMNAVDAKYWVDMKNVGSRCSALSQDGSEEHDCNAEEFGFICETVRPHMLRISDRNPVVSKSGDVQIECSASGFPLPHVAWYKDDELLPGQSFGTARSTLNIKNVMPEDAGSYTCIASNTVNGEEKRTMSIARIAVNSN